MATPFSQRVLVDSNILYSKCLRDWLGVLVTREIEAGFVVHWTEEILADVIKHLRRNHPEWSGAQTRRVHDVIVETFWNGRVEDFVVDGSYAGKDPEDAYVHAAALACDAHYLLTVNTRDFPDTDALTYEVLSPDEFLLLVDDSTPSLVRLAVGDQVRYWLQREGEADLPGQLRRSGCPHFAERVRRHLQAISQDL